MGLDSRMTAPPIYRTCQHCGLTYGGDSHGTCPRIQSIEYAADGVTIRKIVYHPPTPYPTPEAYAAACRALDHWRDEATRLSRLAGEPVRPVPPSSKNE